MIHQQTSTKNIHPAETNDFNLPLLIGEGLHILNNSIEEAIVKQDKSALQKKAREEIAAGARGLAVNLGPGKMMADLTPWVVDTVAEEIDAPLFVSSGITASKEVLEKYGSRITINAVTADPVTLADHIGTAKHYGTGLVVLLVCPGRVPAGIEDRLEIAADVIATAMDIGIPLAQLYLDPVLTCRPDPLAWKISRGMPDISSMVETLSWIKALDQNIRTIIALRNGTGGVPPGRKHSLQSRMLQLFSQSGLDAVILNCRDNLLMQNIRQYNTAERRES